MLYVNYSLLFFIPAEQVLCYCVMTGNQSLIPVFVYCKVECAFVKLLSDLIFITTSKRFFSLFVTHISELYTVTNTTERFPYLHEFHFEFGWQ